MNEQTLSDKGYSYPSAFGLDFHGEDVKDFIKKLKEELELFDTGGFAHNRRLRIIDKLAGDKLI